MDTFPAPKTRNKPLILTPRDEEILATIYRYRYMTSLDVAHLLFKPSYLTYVRSRLSRLAGGADLQPNTYLCRFKLPSDKVKREHIFTLGMKGRNFLARERGLPVDWYFRPYKLRDFSYSHILHNLILTRILIAAQKQSAFKVVELHTSYDLSRDVSITVVPDAWLLLERKDGKKFPVMIELDRGMEYQQKFKRHIKARIEFVRGGKYAKLFHTKAVLIAYATTGQTQEYRERRRETMCLWTKEVLAELHLKNWAGIFRFHSLVLDHIYDQSMFEKPVWYRPDSAEPLPLLASSIRGENE